MKRLLVSALAVALVCMCMTAVAHDECKGKPQDRSWWGKSGATPAPVKATDSCAKRPGYWWWPTEPASNAGDSELWGNRGVVYSMYAQEEKTVQPPPPPPPPPATPSRVTPVFSNVLFDFDKSNIRPDAAATLDQVVSSMKKFPKDTVVIEGHTCNVGEDAYNMGLGQRRANSVKKYLEEHGVEAARLSASSLGETQPAVPNDTPANRKLNRRVVFKVSMGQ